MEGCRGAEVGLILVGKHGGKCGETILITHVAPVCVSDIRNVIECNLVDCHDMKLKVMVHCHRTCSPGLMDMVHSRSAHFKGFHSPFTGVGLSPLAFLLLG